MASIFNLINPQRYFHVVVFNNENDFFNKRLLKILNFEVEFSYNDIDNVEINQLSIVSNLPFYRGEKDFSVNSDGKAPFKYDSILINQKSLGISMLCLPFKLLAKVIVEKLINDHNVLAKNNFVKVDLNKLIKSNHNHTDYYTEDLTYFFSSINLTLKEESTLSSVKLDGDKPIDSSLYKEVFKNKINDGKCSLEKCVLKLNTSISENSNVPKTKAAVHIDTFGNYKLYVHTSGNNTVTLPLLFENLEQMGCLNYTPINPIKNLKEEI
ncbi:MAG: hypothetical protein ED556_08160 [Winogradskyella sp.]|uniref:hypothetical protein n=1 Tax=Winogradskyella sp. TaxID=1883156 RepID=UPI000F3C60EB|nr:hypothetical protein [Winogradskyella sp.]RNC86261.1 MAG: hypothetical protein ED556_08160 [Winogradskyella sp.]